MYLPRALSVSSVFETVGTSVVAGVCFIVSLLVVLICWYAISCGRATRGVSKGEACVSASRFFSSCMLLICHCKSFISASCFAVRSFVMSIAVFAIIALISARVMRDDGGVAAGRGVALGGAVCVPELVVPVTAGCGFVFGVAVELLELVELGVADTSGVSFSSSW
jgi:hypothetical protein